MSHPIKPISLQLYTLREEAAKDFRGVLKRVADIGYKGVEPAGLFDFTPQDFRAFVQDLGMVISSIHSRLLSPDTLSEALAEADVLGVKHLVTGYGPEDFRTLDSIKETAEITAQMDEKIRQAGHALAIHNHWWEFEKIDGRIKHEIFAGLCPNVNLELDTYWAANFGENSAVDMMRRFADRAPLLHIKDGPMIRPRPTQNAEEAEPSTALLPLGKGKNDIDGIVAALNPGVTEWLIVEQDDSDSDMFACVEESYRYLTSRNLAAGNK